MGRVKVVVSASDPVSHAGVSAMLRTSAEIDLLAAETGERADVVVLVERIVDATRLHAFGRSRGAAGPVCVVVAGRFDPDDTLLAVRLGVKSVLPASHTTAADLVAAVVGATRKVSLLPSTLQMALLRKLEELRSTVLEPNGLSLSRLDRRERNLVEHVAEGLDTDEIALRIGCSEGTVRNTLHSLMRRLGLSNRSHVVAYALRSGALH